MKILREFTNVPTNQEAIEFDLIVSKSVNDLKNSAKRLFGIANHVPETYLPGLDNIYHSISDNIGKLEAWKNKVLKDSRKEVS